MDIKLLSALQPEDWHWVHQCWNAANPATSQFKTTEELVDTIKGLANQNHYLAINDAGIIGWAVTYDSRLGREFLILVDNNNQHKGIGSKIVRTMQATEQELNSWIIDHDAHLKSDGSVYYSPMMFYLKHGFMVIIDERHNHFGVEKTRISWASNSKF